jgi:hypothetical protein
VKFKRQILVAAILASAVCASAWATDGFFAPRPRATWNHPRSAFWMPLGSFLAPGLDQWVENEFKPAALYSGVGIFGLSLLATNGKRDTTDAFDNWNHLDDRDRRAIYGAQLYQTAGSLSAYHSFRTAVKSHNNAGSNRFDFLTPTLNEDEGDLLLAPFQIQFLKKWTTFLPLGILLGLMVVENQQDGRETEWPIANEQGFALAISYNAGVGEEALFRGWLQPNLRAATESSLLSNFIQGTLFGYMHVKKLSVVPVPQLLAGYYFGWLTERNKWSIQETAFIHAWWDIIVLTNYATRGDRRGGIFLPLIDTTF